MHCDVGLHQGLWADDFAGSDQVCFKAAVQTMMVSTCDAICNDALHMGQSLCVMATRATVLPY